MKRILTFALLAGALCACVAIDKSALWPAVKSAWPAVRADVVRGGADPSMFDPLIDTENAIGLVSAMPTWPAMDASAKVGIQARVAGGEISLGVAQSILERLSNFGIALSQLTKGIMP